MPFRKQLIENNRRWAAQMTAEDPEFFSSLAHQQVPKFLWIGCSDSRVPANEIVGLRPGELFVHRNVANVVVHSDLNCLAVLQYAIDVLKVKHVMVCGHYGCGGVLVAMRNKEYGLIDNWLRHIKDVYERHRTTLDRIADETARARKLCELNVLHQVTHVAHTTIAQDAWRRGRTLSVHGFIYDVHDGLLKDLGLAITGPDDIPPVYRMTR